MRHYLFAIIILFVSCGELEENDLIETSKKNGSYKIIKTEEKRTDKDSIWFNEESFKIYDAENRILNLNNQVFNFYNSANKITAQKLIYRRGGKGIVKILERKYNYDAVGNLISIVEHNGMSRNLKYDSENRLIEDDNGFRKTTYKYSQNLLQEEILTENESEIWRLSYEYDKLGKLISEVKEFDEHRVKTEFEYLPNGKIMREWTKSLDGNPVRNEIVDFLTVYKYFENDSLKEERYFGRTLNSKEFFLRGRTNFEYKKVNGL